MSNNERHVVPFWVKLPWHHLTSFSPTCHSGPLEAEGEKGKGPGIEGVIAAETEAGGET